MADLTASAAGAPGTNRTARTRSLTRRLRTTPLRWRLLAVTLGLIAVALAATSLVVSALLRVYLVNQTEQELDVYASSLAAVQLSELQRAGSSLPTNFTARIIDLTTGRVESLGDAAFEADRAAIPNLPLSDPRVTNHTTFDVSSQGGEGQWLALARLNDEGSAIVVVALPLRPLEATVTQFLLYAALIGAIAIVVSGALGWYLVRRTFRPLTRIEDTAAKIAVGDLTQRVDVPDTDDEVASLSRSLNSMLARIEQSFAVREANEAKMRRFIADASHELRTPLAAVGGYAELYRQGALPTADAVTGAMGRIESEAHRMSGLVEDLLTLARLDGERPLELQTVDLAVLAADAAQDARTIAPGRHIVTTGINGPIEPTELQADERQLRQVVTNLVTNARVHTPDGTSIEILVGRGDQDHVALHVCDHGHGIPKEDRLEVFERFYRADWSRSRGKGGGNGLGLAIVHAIVGAHGGRVRVEETAGGGATVVVELPVQPPLRGSEGSGGARPGTSRQGTADS
ncbi:HAMP domain-containing sensor histidine kinase [Terrabacter sp. MAHUQ-38]|uniref:sensor histidine kinase n=1 Tax=unclassified Terrabacter TaxID=2630222 RepID=UPI00165EA2F2|nr:HAMP domain-containing sensor histidine kinase [Terrabacter sp. MAHUQ-38]MBC9822221.1 HAMP domain-containing histidine kinase [Terrabacter sp. MAHUQ-38]